MSGSDYLTTADAAAYANCCEETIRRGIRSGGVRAVRIGRTWRVRPEWVDAWLFAGVSDAKPGDPATVGALPAGRPKVN